MTNAQVKTIEKIKKMANAYIYNDDYELKQFDVKENDIFVSVIVETGLKNDEGTLAAIIGRNRAHLYVGKRGGITYPVYKKNKSFTKRLLNGESLLTVYLDQK